MQMNKRKLRKKAKHANTILVLSVLLMSITLSAVLVCMLAWKVRSSQKEPLYEYVSMSEEAAARAYIWLNQIEDMPLTYTEIKQMMGDIHLTLVLNPTEEKGKYARTLADGTVSDCQNRAWNGLEEAYREVVRYRLMADGQKESISDEEMDELMREAYGVSVAEYLASCEVQLLPAIEELTEAYLREAVYE